MVFKRRSHANRHKCVWSQRCSMSATRMLAWWQMKAVSRDSSSGYDQPQWPKKRKVCKRGCSKGRKILFWLLQHIKPKRKQSSHLPIPKRLPLLAFLRVICVHLLYCKTFHVCKCVVLWVEMSGDMSACVCVDIGPVLVRPGPRTVFISPMYWMWLHVSQWRRHTMLEESQVILCLIVNTSPVLSLLKVPVSTRCCWHIKHFDLSHLKFPGNSIQWSRKSCGHEVFLQWLAIPLCDERRFRQHPPHSVIRVNHVSLELCYALLEWWIAGVMCDHHGRTFMAQFDLVRKRFAPRCSKSFFRGLFQGLYVIASREQGGLNFFRTGFFLCVCFLFFLFVFFLVSRSEQSRRTLRSWLDGMFLYTCGGWQDRRWRYPCALVWRSVWR